MRKVEIIFDSLPRLPENWEWQPLEEIVQNPKQEIVDGPFGSNLKASEYVDEGVPIARLQNIDRHEFVHKNIRFISPEKAIQLARHSFKAGDLLITKLGNPLGKACLAPNSIGHGVIVADLVRVRIGHDEVDSRYLMYAINSPFVARQFEKHTKGTTRPRVNLGIVRSLPIPVAPKSQQKRIVAEIEKQFSRLDEAITSLKRTKANLKRYKAAVEGKLTEEWREQHPDVEPASKLLERILAERREKWNGKGKYSESEQPDITGLPKLPDGWIWACLEAIAALKGGITVDKNRKSSSARKILYLRVANVQRGYLDLSEIKEIDAPEADIRDLRLVLGDIYLMRAETETNSAEDGFGRTNFASVFTRPMFSVPDCIWLTYLQSWFHGGETHLEKIISYAKVNRQPILHQLT
jgi:type I restriction enzyme, S subunit